MKEETCEHYIRRMTGTINTKGKVFTPTGWISVQRHTYRNKKMLCLQCYTDCFFKAGQPIATFWMDPTNCVHLAWQLLELTETKVMPSSVSSYVYSLKRLREFLIRRGKRPQRGLLGPAKSGGNALNQGESGGAKAPGKTLGVENIASSSPKKAVAPPTRAGLGLLKG